jgi:hypothetical protein
LSKIYPTIFYMLRFEESNRDFKRAVGAAKRGVGILKGQGE